MADYDGKQDSIFREPLVSVVYLYMYIDTTRENKVNVLIKCIFDSASFLKMQFGKGDN